METTQLTAAQVNPAGAANGLQISNVTVFGLMNGVLAYHAKAADENETNRDTADNLQNALNQKMLNLTAVDVDRSEEHTSELQSLMRISYAVFCLKKKNKTSNEN